MCRLAKPAVRDGRKRKAVKVIFVCLAEEINATLASAGAGRPRASSEKCWFLCG